MTIVKTKATELVDVKARWVSLVPKAANRTGFKIVKEDSSMLDLSKLGLNAAVSGEPASVYALVVRKSDDGVPEGLAALVEKHGFNPLPSLSGDTWVFRRKGEKEPQDADVHVISMTPEVAVVAKYFTPWSGQISGFGEKVVAQNFGMSVSTAFGVAQDLIGRMMHETETDQAIAEETIKGVMQEATDYVLNLVRQLPQEAFIVPEEVSRELSKLKTKKSEEITVKKPKKFTDAEWSAMGEEKQKAFWADNAKRREEKKQKAAAAAKTAEGEAKKSDADFAVAIGEAIAKALDPVSKSIAAFTQRLDALDTRVGEVAKKADTATEKLTSTVIAGGANADPKPSAPAKKAEAPPAWTDSAFRN